MTNPQTDDAAVTIGSLARMAGVNVETIRFYQRKGLLPLPDRPVGGVRRYGEAQRARVSFVKSAQRLGFSLDEIAELLRLEDGTGCAQARTHAEAKLVAVRARMADLQRIEQALSGLVELCSTTIGQVRCPLIEALSAAPEAQR